MSELDRRIKQARLRLWLNRWLVQFGWSLLVAGILLSVLLVSDRLFALQLPMWWAAAAALWAGVIGSVAWLWITRESGLAAAMALDHGAGLRERVSTGMHARSESDDPFAAAVVYDAERRVTGLSVRKVLPLRWPRSLSAGAVMLIVAALSMRLPVFDVLNRNEALAKAEDQQLALARVRSVVAKPVSAISQSVGSDADEDVKRQLTELERALQPDSTSDAAVLRREALKKLDRLEDTFKTKSQEERFKALEETKKRLKMMGGPRDPQSELKSLIESLSAGDFQDAQAELKRLQEQLAKRDRAGKTDPKQVEQLKKQLDNLAKQLQQAGEDQQQSQRELQNAGMSEADVKRVLDALAKKDPKQLEKMAKELAERLKEQGVSEEQLRQMMEKLAQRQQASEQLKKMAEKFSGAAGQLQQGNTEAAQDELGEAGEMLSEMEQLEQSLNELEAQMAMVSDARDELSEEPGEDDLACKQCNGTGFRKDGAACPHCNGSGECSGGGDRGRAFGARQRDDNVQVAFKNSKAQVKTTKGGRIISQQFVKGEQLKGKSEAEFYDAAMAAEIEATDALNRDRIPRMYRKGVRDYFDRLGENFKPEGGGDAPPKDDPPPESPDKK